MTDEQFIKKYEELLDEGYCDCNEMNCLDNNTPRRILSIVKKLQKENQVLKQNLNWIAFSSHNCDTELALRYLRKIGYVNFDEERKVYINKHNNEPFELQSEKEKGYYIKDDEINEYIQQLECKIAKYEKNERNDS